MKIRKLLTLLLALVFFVGCSNQGKTEVVKADTNIKIFVSNYPLYDFTKKIAGDKVEVVNVTKNQGFHGWEPTARDIADIKSGDLFIYNGPEIETWAADMINSGTIDIETLVASEGVDFLESAHSHYNHDHEESHEHDHSHGDIDPHIWLSLKNSKKMLENITEKLIELDSENEQYYKENYEKYSEIFEDLDKKYEEELSNKVRDTIIVSHEAYGYLCRDYNFKQVGIEGIHAEGEPSVQQIDNIIKLSKELGTNVIFYEHTISPKVAEMIAEQIGAELILLNPIETLTEEEIENGEDYVSLMEWNLQGLRKGLVFE